jgi:hypothetical protein
VDSLLPGEHTPDRRQSIVWAKVLAVASAAVAITGALMPVRFPAQICIAVLWLGLTILSILTGRRRAYSAKWTLILAPVALAKCAVGLCIYASCVFNYPAGCP